MSLWKVTYTDHIEADTIDTARRVAWEALQEMPELFDYCDIESAEGSSDDTASEE